MGVPPFEGADQTSATVVFPAVAEARVGALGAVAGVAESAFEAGPAAIAFVASAGNGEVVPFVIPPTVQDNPPVEHVAPPGLAVAVYEVIVEPPSEAGADHARATCPSPRVAEVNVGAPGNVAGVAVSAFEAGPAPTKFLAVTVRN